MVLENQQQPSGGFVVPPMKAQDLRVIGKKKNLQFEANVENYSNDGSRISSMAQFWIMYLQG